MALNEDGTKYIYSAFAEHPKFRSRTLIKTMFKLEGKTLQLGKAFTHNGMQYPSNWLALTSLEEKQAIGIVEVPDAPVTGIYDQRFYCNVEKPKQLNDVTDERNTALVSKVETKQDDAGSALLSKTDWRVIKVKLRTLTTQVLLIGSCISCCCPHCV